MNENTTAAEQTEDTVQITLPKHVWQEVIAGLTIARDHCREHGDPEAAAEAEELALEIAKQADPVRYAIAKLFARLAKAARR